MARSGSDGMVLGSWTSEKPAFMDERLRCNIGRGWEANWPLEPGLNGLVDNWLELLNERLR